MIGSEIEDCRRSSFQPEPANIEKEREDESFTHRYIMHAAGFHTCGIFVSLFLFIITIHHVTSLQPRSPLPSAEYKTASAIPSPPLDSDPFVPSPVENFLTAAFRWTLQRQSGTIIADKPGFDGMMEELMTYRIKHGPEELERVSYRTMIALGGPIPFIYKYLFGWLEATPAILAWFAKFLLPFLVGDMALTTKSDDDPRGGGVLVKRCRVLEGSGCKGICAKMCKGPTQRFFQEQWGVPLTMNPNFETGECQLVFGEVPIPIEEDPTIPPGCLTRCSASRLMEGNELDQC